MGGYWSLRDCFAFVFDFVRDGASNIQFIDTTLQFSGSGRVIAW